MNGSSAGEPSLKLTRRRVGGNFRSGYRYVVEGDAGVPRASCSVSGFSGKLQELEADGVAYRVHGRQFFEVETGRKVLERSRGRSFAVEGRDELVGTISRKDPRRSVGYAHQALLTFTDSDERVVMRLTWEGRGFGHSAKTYELGTAMVSEAALGADVALATAVAFYVFSLGWGGTA
jgi:hypothetical protein